MLSKVKSAVDSFGTRKQGKGEACRVYAKERLFPRYLLLIAFSFAIVAFGVWAAPIVERGIDSAVPLRLFGFLGIGSLLGFALLGLLGLALVVAWYWYFRYGRMRYPYPAASAVEQMILDDGLYETETREFTNGKTSRRSEMITGSAEFSVYEDSEVIVVVAYKVIGKWYGEAGKYEERLSTLFNLPVASVDEDERGFTYRFEKHPHVTERIALCRDRYVPPAGLTRDTIPIDSDVSWRIGSVPHALIVGGTGSGKSRFLTYLLLAFATIGDVVVCDPKNADLAGLRHVLPDGACATSPNDIAACVRKAVDEMERRYAKFASGKSAYGTDWRDWREDDGTPVKSYWLCFDEYAAFSASADMKIAKETESRLFELILKGRQAGVMVVLVMQRPDANLLPTIIRDNLSFRVGMGNLSRMGKDMVFGNLETDEMRQVTEKGAGFCFIDGNGWEEPRYTEFPLVPDGLDFLGQFEAVYYSHHERQTAKEACDD